MDVEDIPTKKNAVRTALLARVFDSEHDWSAEEFNAIVEAVVALRATPIPTVASGTYTPTASNVQADVSNIAFPEAWLWSRCGSVVRVLGRVSFDVGATTLIDTALFDLTLPITVGSAFRAWGVVINYYVKHASITGPGFKCDLVSGKLRATCELQQSGTGFIASFDIAYVG